MPKRQRPRCFLALALLGLAAPFGNAADLVAFSPSTNALAVAERASKVRVVDPSSGKEKWSQDVFHLTVGKKSTPLRMIYAVAFTSDGKTLAVGGGVLYHGHVVLFDAASGKPAHIIRDVGPSEFVVLALSPDGKTLCTGARFGPAFLFDVQTGERKRMLETKGLLAVAFSADGILVAGACADENNSDNIKRDVKIWNTETGKVMHTIPEAGGPVAFSPDGKLIAGLAGERSLALWEVGAQKPKRVLGDIADKQRAVHFTFSPDARLLAVVEQEAKGAQQQVVLWRTDTGKRLPKVADGPSLQVSFSADGKMLHVATPAGVRNVEIAKIAAPDDSKKR
jgi:WD40 repeat protein